MESTFEKFTIATLSKKFPVVVQTKASLLLYETSVSESYAGATYINGFFLKVFIVIAL